MVCLRSKKMLASMHALMLSSTNIVCSCVAATRHSQRAKCVNCQLWLSVASTKGGLLSAIMGPNWPSISRRQRTCAHLSERTAFCFVVLLAGSLISRLQERTNRIISLTIAQGSIILAVPCVVKMLRLMMFALYRCRMPTATDVPWASASKRVVRTHLPLFPQQ